MNWQTLSIVSCLSFGIGAVLISSALKTQSSLPSMMCYATGLVVTVIIAAAVESKPLSFGKASVVLAIGSGVCTGVAVLLQFAALSKWNDKAPWIILIGALYPAITLIYALCLGRRFTLTQWLGVLFAIVAIVLINLPSKTNTAPQ